MRVECPGLQHSCTVSPYAPRYLSSGIGLKFEMISAFCAPLTRVSGGIVAIGCRIRHKVKIYVLSCFVQSCLRVHAHHLVVFSAVRHSRIDKTNTLRAYNF